jgi:hypothetical protein
MASCQCGHPDSDHKLRHTCEEVIVYPSEEYPCGCERFAPSMSDDCITCGHVRAKHSVIVRCRPSSGEICGCISRIGQPK